MAEAMGLRERKKLETGLRIWRTAISLFSERGYDDVSVAEIAAASDVSKMTVFNYFGSKDDLVFAPMQEHFADGARAVRDRAPGESAVAAMRRQFLEALEERDPSVGASGDPITLKVFQLVQDTPVLFSRARLLVIDAAEELVGALLAEDGSADETTARVAAGVLTATRAALIAANRQRQGRGESADEIAAASAAEAERAFALVEHGLGAYPGR
ncbi:helix-turn-helix domain-containing protein [Streptomyces sp. NPDC051940]|uniref:TetR/AcrR family transcriptional regulator n=1 Tax=Streptomyces sp. NPDC051940 TaxID=3155675 RepID=UPI003413A91F